jgi:hypothetical protein
LLFIYLLISNRKSAAQITLLQNKKSPVPSNNMPQPYSQSQPYQGQMHMQQMHMQQMQQQMQLLQPSPQSNYYNNNNNNSNFVTGMEVDSQTVEIGNLFHYEIQTPISLEKFCLLHCFVALFFVLFFCIVFVLVFLIEVTSL